jgi:hypothetical protein
MEGDREIVEYGMEEWREDGTLLGGSGRERVKYGRGERGSTNIVDGKEDVTWSVGERSIMIQGRGKRGLVRWGVRVDGTCRG